MKDNLGKVVGLMDVRAALNDERFRKLFPELNHQIDKYLKDPKCGSCSVPLVREILHKYPDRVKEYFPGRTVVTPDDEKRQLSENNWSVINCHITDLEKKLRALPPGRKQLAIARFEDQVTVVINELTVIM